MVISGIFFVFLEKVPKPRHKGFKAVYFDGIRQLFPK
ncbi:hypothetical protein HDEF_0523 [Candidatus Hamiltonella defensa 5AT (Acyrthosiphon pisum)]|uniref:Uncharacterized protein n=1 Tax=Hamiltonella defensa subsp. Acyrthosiphon pisum (strain 5AT) TaxID=572265 RepID=C4K3Y4_HAMD5|nr:hypothetical protein HDEF_0523 [Candidatus Hamiltonella defensa 5AT (Acyrthosiphon pisum)]